MHNNSTPDSPDAIYSSARACLARGDIARALFLLEQSLGERPRASQTLYLFGIANMLAGEFSFGSQCINRAYQIKPWIRDDISDLRGWAELIASTSNFGDEWAKYQSLRYKHVIVGHSYNALLDTLILKQKKVTFIEIGANDGKSGDPLYPYIVDGRLKGILIEPQLSVFDELKKTYASTKDNTFLNIGVSDKSGKLKLYASETSTLTSAQPDKNSLRSTDGLTELIVPVKTLEAILKKYENQPDILQIDTEGHEYHILRVFPLKQYPFKIIHIEFYCLSLTERIAIFELLLDAGYIWHFDGMNLTALRTIDFPEILWKKRSLGNGSSLT